MAARLVIRHEYDEGHSSDFSHKANCHIDQQLSNTQRTTHEECKGEILLSSEAKNLINAVLSEGI